MRSPQNWDDAIGKDSFSAFLFLNMFKTTRLVYDHYIGGGALKVPSYYL